jgi:hypothetical protein
MMELVATYSAPIIGIAVAVVMLGMQPQFAARRWWIVAGAVCALVLYIGLDLTTKGSGLPLLPIAALVFAGGLLVATLTVSRTRSHLDDRSMLLAVGVLAAMVIGSALAVGTGGSGVLPALIGTGLGLLPFALLVVVVLSVSWLRRGRTPS